MPRWGRIDDSDVGVAWGGSFARGEVVVTFLALLELIRLQQLAAWQEGPLMPIRIRRAPEPVLENLPLSVPEEVPQIPGEGAGQSPDLSAV